eukprot:747359-Hanusia_phi.AAC.2
MSITHLMSFRETPASSACVAKYFRNLFQAAFNIFRVFRWCAPMCDFRLPSSLWSSGVERTSSSLSFMPPFVRFRDARDAKVSDFLALPLLLTREGGSDFRTFSITTSPSWSALSACACIIMSSSIEKQGQHRNTPP